MKKLILGPIVFVLLSFLNYSMACETELKGLEICADIKWLQGPKYGIFSKVEVTYYKKTDAKKTPIDPVDEIEVYPWMIMAGGMEHGSRDTVTKRISAGVFEVNFIQFMKMNDGHWELRFKKKGTHSKTASLANLKVELPQ